MPLRVVVLGIDGQGQRSYGVDERRRDFPEQPFCFRMSVRRALRLDFGRAEGCGELMQAFANLVERLRARGEQPFESYAEISL